MNAIRLSLKLLAATGVAVLALAGALWLWSGTDSSLATLLTRLQRFLPADQTLEAKDVRGSLQAGGHIGWLRWRRGELSVEAQDIGVAWTLGPLFNKQLRLHELTIATLKIEDLRPSAGNTPPTPLTDLTLPITIDVPFKVATISWTGATTLQATEVSGHYIFDSYSHILNKGKGHISSGNYQLVGQLQATAPMALTLQVNGQVVTTVPSSQKPLTVAATAKLAGELAGPAALLALQATLTPELPAGPALRTAKAEAMQATLSAKIQPWQAQPLAQANAQWQGLNLTALWPQAPQTQLTGDASVVPAGEGWRGKVDLTNALPGPWNEQRLPLATFRADVDYAHAQWALHSIRALGAGGTVTGSGQFNAGLWTGSASLQGVNPAYVDSRLASTAINGTLQARQTTSGIGFTAQLDANPAQPPSDKSGQPARSVKKSPQPDSLQALQLQSLRAEGVWAAPLLTLKTLRVDAHEARLDAENLQYHTASQAAQGRLTLTLPGLNGALEGHLSSVAGQGKLTVRVIDAAKATHWLSRFPQVDGALQQASIEGAAELKADWQGGWQNQGRSLKMDATLRAPKLDWAGAHNETAWHLSDLQADLSGNLAALQLRTQGLAKTGTHHIDWQAQLSGGQLESNHWQGALNQLKLATRDSAQPGTWSLQLADAKKQAVSLEWLQNNLTQTLTVGGSTAQLTGPQPGIALLSWQPIRWSQQRVQSATRASTKALWQSQGQITQLPLAWLDALSGKSMADLGVSSDVILAGNWDAKHTDTLHLNAMLERSSGDLRLNADASRKRVLPADMQEARLNVNMDGEQLSGSLRWDSERAGKALMAFSTQLQPLGQGWRWSDDAPLGGSLYLQMPPVDAWSMLAPPGWRLRGTLDANATLTGTRKLPQWRGTLLAKDLAVRSVADGIDFQQGTLTARLEGQQLHIDDFTLFGAGGAVGGQVKVTGMAKWLPAGKADDALAQRVQLTLEANAKALRLSTRSDRRLTVSGNLSAQLKDTLLTLRGKLSADQALITLPSESTPTLGDDVVVRPSAAQAAQDALIKPKLSSVATTPNPAKRPANAITTDVQVTLDLGPNFQVRGRGLETRLAGSLELRAVGTAAPTLSGTVRTVRGTYQAYGQRLEIEQGLLRFFGPADNPALDILAIRPKMAQRVGVQVLGTVLSPIVRLYAEPELPEAEKLAWLVLGRSASGSGGEAALLQQAALALLGGTGQGPSASLTQALGLDELSFRSSSDNTTSGATVTLGKRLSNDFYVAYESGLAGTMGVFTIFYDLSRRLTLRAQTGEQSAVDLIWTYRYD